jgi:hypothetical protein
MFSALFSLFLFNSIISARPNSNVAVFCSADDKASAHFKSVAHSLGSQLARHNFGLVTGGSRTGLMKEVVDGYANATTNLENLYGILPQALINYNVHHLSIPAKNLMWSKDIHSRLSDFHALTDIIIILPGGYGTLHELMDFLVHNQFGIHKTQIILLNIDGFWNHLLSLFKSMADQQLVSLKHLNMLTIVQSVEECIQCINSVHEVQDLASHYWEQNK